MFPFEVDPKWYEKHWLTDQPSRPSSSASGLAQFAVVVVLLLGSGVAFTHFAAHIPAADQHGLAQE